jgi:hypothetical protein
MIQDILAEPEWGQAPRAVREFLGSHKHHYRALKALQNRLFQSVRDGFEDSQIPHRRKRQIRY